MTLIFFREDLRNIIIVPLHFFHHTVLSHHHSFPTTVSQHSTTDYPRFYQDSMYRTLKFLLALSAAGVSLAQESNDTKKYVVKAYECDDKLERLSTEDRQRKVQGVPVRICLQPDESAQNDGIGIDHVESWTWETTFQGGEAKQTAVKDGKDDGMLSSVHCRDSGKVCVLDTMLTAKFYQNAGSVIGLGQVTLTSDAGTIDVQKDLFQSEFHFKFTHGPGGDEMSPEETQELLTLMAEQQAEKAKEKGQEAIEAAEKAAANEL